MSARYISVTANVFVRDSVASEPSQPKTFTTNCDFTFRTDGPITIPVVHYCPDGAPAFGCAATVTGELFFPPGDSDGHVQASQFIILADADIAKHLKLGAAAVVALGTLATVIGRDWFLDVAVYERSSKSTKTFSIIVTIPDSPRYQKLKSPGVGRSVLVRGLLSSISVSEDIAMVDLESITYVPTPNPVQAPGTPLTGSGGKSKRQIRSERGDSGSPMKKFKSGPIEAFTPEELSPVKRHPSGSSSTSTQVSSLSSS
ncbi:hypothetical protein BDV93DRAFT_551052 [Ceratobasidium sp. AG-I]|nr:hypothetical protein BDV93DRAFT_551052 [Ceratobasidium sp. AG-I]